MKLRALIVFLGLLLAPLAAHAQNVTVHVVGTCGLESIPLTAPAWLRMDSTGVLCTSGSGGGGSLSAKATAAAPTYVEGTSNPLSMDLSGFARVLDKNSAAILAGVTSPIPTQAATVPIGATGFIGTNNYETIAASQTNQAMGATGAAGDYLSHCVVTPGTTSPGVVTILDNAVSVVAFPGGASSVSNLVPFTIPVGALSVSGAWKITTGANVTVVCVGKFT